MSDRNLDHLDPALRGIAEDFLTHCSVDPALKGCRIIVTQTWRSPADQNAAYAQGRTTPGPIITNARAGESPHNCMLPSGPAAKAFDFAIECADGRLDWDAADPVWQKAIAIGEMLGLESGAHWHCKLKDAPHLQLPGWKPERVGDAQAANVD